LDEGIDRYFRTNLSAAYCVGRDASLDDRPGELLIEVESGDNKHVQRTWQDSGAGFASSAGFRLMADT
jgi:hypothetical protein